MSSSARPGLTAARRVGPASEPKRVAALCLSAIAANAVLIQTVIPDEESPLRTIVRVAVLALAAGALLVHKAPIPRWVVVTAIVSTILLIVGSNTDQLSYIFAITLALLMTQLGPPKADKFFLCAAFFSLSLVFALLWTGLTINEVRDYRNRSTFGVASVPFFMNVVYGAGAMLILYCRKYRPRGGLAACLAYLAFATYCFIATDARGGYFALLAFIALTAIVPFASRSIAFRAAVALLPAAFLALAFVIASMSGNVGLNGLLSGRPYNYRQLIERTGLTDFLTSASVKQYDVLVSSQGAFGQIQRGAFVDNSYLHLAIGGGIGITLILLAAWASAVFELFRRELHPEIAFMTATALYFNTESLLVRVENVFVVFTWYLIVRYSFQRATRSKSSNPIPQAVGSRKFRVVSGRR